MGWGVHDYPEPKERPRHTCPVCGEECETLYLGLNREVVGCDECISTVDAGTYYEEGYY